MTLAEKQLKQLIRKEIIAFKEAEADIEGMIDTIINTNWSGDDKEQMRAISLMKGLATSDDPKARKFMKALDKSTSDLKMD